MNKKNTGIIILFLSLVSISCYRDQPSSYNIDKIQSIELISPQGGEKFRSDQPIQVKWKSVNINSNLLIGLIENTVLVYIISNIPDTESYNLQIPVSLVPSKNYKLIIESMKNPNVHDVTGNYFEIVPAIDGHWFYSDVEEGAGMEISLDLVSYIGNSFTGEGTFYFKYSVNGGVAGYESNITTNGILTYPDIGFQIKGEDNRIFDLNGQMINSGEIKGRITGFIDSTYGIIDDSLVLIRQ